MVATDEALARLRVLINEWRTDESFPDHWTANECALEVEDWLDSLDPR
jgi:hypothetical protein